MTEHVDLTHIKIPSGRHTLLADMEVVPHSQGVILFVHGSGSNRKSERNRFVAQMLRRHGYSSLLLDLLSVSEQVSRRDSNVIMFDIDTLANRVCRAVQWLTLHPLTSALPIGLFGASTGAAAAIVAATQCSSIKAIVSRGGRVDLAAERLFHLATPTLLIVGDRDEQIKRLNAAAMMRIPARPVAMRRVQGATHLFAEEGALETVADLAACWYTIFLTRASAVSDTPRPLAD